MSSRILFAIFALAVLGLPAQTQAEADRRGYAPKARYHHYGASRRYRRIYSYRGKVGGYRHGDDLPPFAFGAGNNYPGYYNNQTFWERVQTQAGYPVQY